MLFLFTLVLMLLSCTRANKNDDTQESIKKAVGVIPVKTIFTIAEEPVSDQEFDSFMQFKYSDMSKQPEMSERLKSRILDAFIEHSLLLISAKKDGITITPSETATYLSNLKIDSKEHETKAMESEALIQKYLFSKVYQEIDVDDNECQDYYKKNRHQFKKNKQIMLHQILLKDQKHAFEIKEILSSNPSRFEEFALSESIALDAKNNGVMGFFELGQLPQEIEKYVFALKKNDISQVIQSPYGYHIFRVSQIRPSHDLYFDSVKEEIKNNLLSVKLRQAYSDYLAVLKQNFTIVILFENLPFKYVSNDYGGDHDTIH